MFRRNRNKFVLVAGLVVTTALATGCGGNGNESGNEVADAAEGGGQSTLTVAQQSDAVTLDPHGSNDTSSAQVNEHIFDTLVHMDENMEIHPQLAESWEQIDDVTWEFTLRDDVYFHNGERFTAEDVLFTFTRAAEVEAIAPIVQPIDPESIEIIDEHTVRIGTHEPFAPLLSNLAHSVTAILNQSAIEEYGDDAGRNPIGTGPFKFVRWETGNFIELTRNENYWGELPVFENLVIRTIIEGASRTIELETGGIDIALQVSPTDIPLIVDHEDLNLLRGSDFRSTFLTFNNEQPPFDQIEVRQAINYLLDVDLIVETVFEGTATPAIAPLAPTVFGSHDSLPQLEVNIDRARELLAEAGFPDGFTSSIHVPNRPLDIELATIVSNQLRQVGIDARPNVLEWGIFLDETAQGLHDMAFLGWTTVTGDADNGLYPQYHSSQRGAGGNRSFFSHERVDQLLDEARVSTDEATRLNAYLEVQEILFEQLPKVYLTHGEVIVGTRNTVQGFELHPGGIFDFSPVYFSE